MAVEISQGRQSDPVTQFSVFTPNRLGRLNQLVGLLASKEVHVLALMVLDTTDSAIIRLIVDDPESARSLMRENAFPFSENPIVVVQFDSTTELKKLVSALLEAEVNVNYLYSFIPHPLGKSLLALSIEDSDVAEEVLRRHQFQILKQSDISR